MALPIRMKPSPRSETCLLSSIGKSRLSGNGAPPPFYRAAVVAHGVDGSGMQIVPPGSNRPCKIDGTALRIWECLEYPATRDEIVAALRAEYAADGSTLARDVETFLSDMATRGLVVLANPPSREDRLRQRYLWLLKRSLVNLLYPEDELRWRNPQVWAHLPRGRTRDLVLRDIGRALPDDMGDLRRRKVDGKAFGVAGSHTMIGLQRLSQLERCAETLFEERVPGDFLEAGVCQGGASIFLRALQVSYGQRHRLLWAADSFRGLPPATSPVDLELGMHLDGLAWLSYSLEEVRENFRRYDLLDEGVHFLPGWFGESLPDAPVKQIALLRLDGDLYSSTRETLDTLYSRVAPGGFVVVDDYFHFRACSRAVDEFRASRQIESPIQRGDWNSAQWRKEG